jgi:hypothetical protein
MPLSSYEQAKKAKEQAKLLTGNEYEIIEYYKSSSYYIRRKPKQGK